VFLWCIFIVKVHSQNCTVCLSIINALRSSTVPDHTIAIECPDEECTVYFLSQLDNLIVAIHRDNEDRDICKSLNFCSDHSEKKVIESKLKCGVCVAALNQVWAQLSIDATSRAVINILKETCPKYPSAEDFCMSLQMKGSVSRIIGGIIANKTPRMTCTELNLCTPESPPLKSEQDSLVPSDNQPSQNVVSSGPSRVKCGICQALYLLVKTSYDSNPDMSQTQQYFSSLCHTAPPLFRNSCDELLSYGSVFQLAIASGSDSVTACMTVNFCSPETLTSPKSASPISAIPPIECQACQWGVSAVEAYLSQDANINDLAYVLEALCTVLPENYSAICRNFIELYLDEALLDLLNTLTPPYVCTKLFGC